MCKEPVQSCVLKGPLDTFPETPAPRAARLVDTNYQPNWTCASPKSLSIYTCCVYIHTRTCIRRHPARRFESVAIMPKLIYTHVSCIYLSMYLWTYVHNMYNYVYTYNCIYVYIHQCKNVCRHKCTYVEMYKCIVVYMYIRIYLYMYTHICIHVYMSICLYVYMCIYIHVYNICINA